MYLTRREGTAFGSISFSLSGNGVGPFPGLIIGRGTGAQMANGDKEWVLRGLVSIGNKAPWQRKWQERISMPFVVGSEWIHRSKNVCVNVRLCSPFFSCREIQISYVSFSLTSISSGKSDSMNTEWEKSVSKRQRKNKATTARKMSHKSWPFILAAVVAWVNPRHVSRTAS